MIGGIHHLGVAVRSLEEGLRVWRDALGLPSAPPETVTDQGVRITYVRVGESRVELLEPTGPDTPVGRFLERHGPGVHHVCLAVTDLEAALEHLDRQGVCLIDRRPRSGAGGARIAFVHPRSTGGVLLELREAPADPEPVQR